MFATLVFVVLAQVADPLSALTLLLKGLETGALWLALPAAVWLVVWALRTDFVTSKVPFLASKLGGVVLAFVSSLALAIIETASSGMAMSAALMLGLVVKVVYGFLGSMGIQSAQKSVAESVAV